MPVYVYHCPVCGHREDQIRRIDDADAESPCNRAGCTGPFLRDVIAGMQVHSDMGYQTPIYSDAAGVHPSQIADAKRANPHHNFTPDGRMIFTSHKERGRVLKDLGMYDRG